MSTNAIRIKLVALKSEALAMQVAFKAFTDRIDGLIQELKENADHDADQATWKREDGRLTDQAIEAIEAMFASGSTVTDVAKHFEITISGASNRKKIWLAKP